MAPCGCCSPRKFSVKRRSSNVNTARGFSKHEMSKISGARETTRNTAVPNVASLHSVKGAGKKMDNEPINGKLPPRPRKQILKAIIKLLPEGKWHTAQQI